MHPTNPNRIVFDLDPAPDVHWSEVKKAALEIRANLKKVKLESFLKTTGGKGLTWSCRSRKAYPGIKQEFSQGFSEVMVKAAPDRFTINSRKNVRGRKIYLDYLRNGKTASAIAPSGRDTMFPVL